MSNKKEEIRQNSELNDEELENVAGGDGKVFRIVKKEKKKKTSYNILNGEGQVLLNLPIEESAEDLANKFDEIKSIDFEVVYRLLTEREK